MHSAVEELMFILMVTVLHEDAAAFMSNEASYNHASVSAPQGSVAAA